MGGSSLTAIVQAEIGGVAVVVLNRKAEELNLNRSLGRSRWSRQFEATPGASGHHVGRKVVATETNRTTDTSAQICDGHYASTYQMAHCSHRPTSPELNAPEFPVQRRGRGRNEGNFVLSGAGRARGSITRATSPNFRLKKTPWRDRGCGSPPERDDAFARSLRKYPSTSSYPSAAVFQRFLKRQSKLLDKALLNTKSLRNLTYSKHSNICINKSSKAVNRKKEHSVAQYWGRKYVTMPVNVKTKSFRCSGYTRSPGPSCSRPTRGNELCKFTNKCNPLPPPPPPPPPGTARGDRKAVIECIRESLQPMYGPMEGPLNASTGSSPKSLHRLRVQKSSDSYASGILGRFWLGKNRSSKIEKEKVFCECKETMQGRQKKQKTENTYHTTPSSQPSKCLAGTCCQCEGTISESDLDHVICKCSAPVKAPPPPSTSDCECVIEDWLRELPIHANETPKDKATRNKIIKELVKTLSDMDDDEFNKEGLEEIKKHVRAMPMWLPKDEDSKETFIDDMSYNLFDRYKAFRDTFRPESGRILDELSEELADEIDNVRPKNRKQAVRGMTDEMRDMHEQLVLDALNEVPEFDDVSENKKKMAAKDVTDKLSDLLVQNDVEKTDSVMRYFIVRNWLALLNRENRINLAPEKQRQIIQNIVEGSKAVQAKFSRQPPYSFGSLSDDRGSKQFSRDQDSRKTYSDGKTLDGVIDEWLQELPTQRSNESPQDKATRDNIVKNLVKTLASMDDERFNREGLNEIKKHVRGMPMWLPKNKDSKEAFIDDISNNLFERTKAFRNEKFRYARGSQLDDEISDELANKLRISPRYYQPVDMMTDELKTIHEQLVLDALNQVSEFDNMSENKKMIAAKDVIQKLSDSLLEDSDEGKIEKVYSVLRFYIVHSWLDQLLRENNINLAPEKQRRLITNIVKGTKAVQAKFSGQSPDVTRGSQLDKSYINRPYAANERSRKPFFVEEPAQTARYKRHDCLHLDDESKSSQFSHKTRPEQDPRRYNFKRSKSNLHPSEIRTDDPSRYYYYQDTGPSTSETRESYKDPNLYGGNRNPNQYTSEIRPGTQDRTQYSPEMRRGIQEQRQYFPEIRPGYPHPNQYPSKIIRAGTQDPSQYSPEMRTGTQEQRQYTPEMRRGNLNNNPYPSGLRPNNLDPNEYPSEIRPGHQDPSNFSNYQDAGHYTPKTQSSYTDSKFYTGNRNPNQFPSEIRTGTQEQRQYSPEISPGNLHTNQYPSEKRPGSPDPSQYSPEMRTGTQERRQNTPGMRPGNLDTNQYPSEIRPENLDPNHYPSEIRPGTPDPRQYSPEMSTGTQEQTQYTPEKRSDNLDPNQYPSEIRPDNVDPNEYPSEIRPGIQKRDTPGNRPGNLDPSKYSNYQDTGPSTSETHASYKDPNLYGGNRNPNQYTSEIRPGTQDPSQYSPEMRPGAQDASPYPPEMRTGTQIKRRNSPEIRPGNLDTNQYPSEIRPGTPDPRQYSPEMSTGTQEQTQYTPEKRSNNLDPNQYPSEIRPDNVDPNEYPSEIRPGIQKRDTPGNRPGNLDPSKYSNYQDTGPSTSETYASYKDPNLYGGNRNPNQYTSEIRPGTQDPSQYSPEMRPGAQDASPYPPEMRTGTQIKRRNSPEIRPGNLDTNQYPSEIRPGSPDRSQYSPEMRTGTQEQRQYTPGMRPGNLDTNQFPSEIRPGTLDPSQYSYYQDAQSNTSETQSSYKNSKHYARNRNPYQNTSEIRTGTQDPSPYSREMRPDAQDPNNYSPEMRPDTEDPNQYPSEIRTGTQDPSQYSREMRPDAQDPNNYSPEMRPDTEDPNQYPSEIRPGAQDPNQYPSEIRPGTEDPSHSPAMRPGNLEKDTTEPRNLDSKQTPRDQGPRQHSPVIRPGDKDPWIYPGSQYPGHSSGVVSPDRQSSDIKPTSPGHRENSTSSYEEPSSTTEQSPDKIIPHDSDEERITTESEFETTFDSIMSQKDQTEASILLELLHLLEQINNAGINSGDLHDKLVKHINELSDRLANNRFAQSYPQDGGADATPEKRNISKVPERQNIDEIEDLSRIGKNIAGPKSPTRVTEKRNVHASPSRSSPRTQSKSPRRSLDDQRRTVSPGKDAKRTSQRGKVEEQVGTTSQRERTLTLKKTMDERTTSSHVNGRKRSPSPAKHKQIMRSKSSGTEPDKIVSKAKSKNEQIYFKNLHDHIEKWVDNLGIDLKGNERNLGIVIANEVLDRQKYLHLNPTAPTWEGEELEDMKYQIFKMLKNRVDPHTIKQVLPHVDQLMVDLEKIPVPNLAPVGKM